MDIKELRLIRNEIINKYQNQMSIEELMNEYNAKWSDIYDVVSTSFKHSIKDVHQSEIDKIIYLYQNTNMSCTKIGAETNIYHKLVAKILDNNNIVRQNRIAKKYEYNVNYFDSIDTPNKAYILGLLFADGYNGKSKQTIRLQLQECDIDVLLRIKDELNLSKSLKFIKCDDKVASNGFISKNMYSLEFYGKHITNRLSELGMTQNKSLTLKFPDYLNEELVPHFVRGYFDGDGSYCHRHTEKYGNRDLITFTSTDEFCKELKSLINHYIDGTGGGIYEASCKNGVTKVLSFSGCNQVKKILDWMYADADIFMKRKYDKYYNNFIAA